ncbi:MAG: glycoside hydrolase family 38 C-terminal domain-containing protein [Victivallales bacterium]
MSVIHDVNKLVVHMIGNAHLDPVWMWGRSDGVGEALATCRTACDLLDDYPLLRITRGEAWVYWQIQRIDPKLFRRIAAHVESGRWCVVNGWWIQPDCNMPMEESFVKQSEIGGRFFKKALGVEVTVGYNVDSFGHCAMMPSLLRKGGKNAYVFTRPGDHEMRLPSNLFRWRSPFGDEVLAFRVIGYAGHAARNVEIELGLVAPGVGHTMCMYGIGDHGGAPTRKQIEWILEHSDYADGVELKFSDPKSFFDCVRPLAAELPVFEGELNPHAVGCYSVVRKQKREMRRAENLMLQAERAAGPQASMHARFEEAWRTVLFNQFHDIFCGSSIESAEMESLDELGSVKTFARDVLVTEAMRRNSKLPPCERQRVVLDNFGDRPWHGLVEYEPWLEIGTGLPRGFRLLDGKEGVVPTQFIHPDAASKQMSRAVFHVELPPGGRRFFELRRLAKSEIVETASDVRADGSVIGNGLLSVSGDAQGVASLSYDGQEILGTAGIRIALFDDPTDTWSHGVLGFEGPMLDEFKADSPWIILENGPLRAELANEFKASASTLRWNLSVDKGEGVLRMKLRLNWREHGKVAKLLIPPSFMVQTRRDGIPAGFLLRKLDGREYPIMNSVSLEGDGVCLTVVSPDVYGADVRPDGTVRLTLLRSPVYANEQDYALPSIPIHHATDQEEHEFEISLVTSKGFDEEMLLDEAARLNNPPLLTETTFGMPSGWVYGNEPALGENSIPYPNVKAWIPEELLSFANAGSISVVKSERLWGTWRGTRLLTCRAKSMKFSLPVPANEFCRLHVAVLTGGRFGRLQLFVKGLKIGEIAGSEGPSLSAFKVETVHAGKIELECVRDGGSVTALAFISVLPSLLDLCAKDWLLSGPYMFDQSLGVERAIREIVFPPELPDHSKTVQWMKSKGQGDDDFIDFRALSQKTFGSIHYAKTYVKSPRRQEAVLSFGIYSRLKLWINGKTAIDNMEGLGHQGGPYKGKFTHQVELEEGWNEILVKIASGSMGNGFWMSVSEFAGIEISQSRK